MGEDKITYSGSSPVPEVVLFIILLVLIALLIFSYKKLNREAEGQYTIRRMIYKEGGVRDRVRGAALAVGALTGVQLWPCSDTTEDGEEMQDMEDEEGQVEGGDSEGSDTEGEQDEDDEVAGGQAKREGSDRSSNRSNSEISEADEQAGLMDEPEAKEETEKKEEEEEKQEKVGEEQSKQEASGGAGLLIDLKSFSGSAIWSGGEGNGGDVTAL